MLELLLLLVLRLQRCALLWVVSGETCVMRRDCGAAPKGEEADVGIMTTTTTALTEPCTRKSVALVLELGRFLWLGSGEAWGRVEVVEKG